MFLVYTLKNGEFEIESLDTCESFEGAQALMYDIAKSLVSRENGENRAKDAYRFTFEELEKHSVPDGYHLENDRNTIKVYHKKTVLESSWLGFTPKITIDFVQRYAITRLPQLKTGDVKTVHIPKPQEKEHGTHVSYISELKDVLKTFQPKSLEEIEKKINLH